MNRLFVGLAVATVVVLGLMAGSAILKKDTEIAGSHFQECETCPEMVVIPPGTFIMGSPETERNRDEDEGQHEVTIAYAFAVSEAPITWDQWEACARDAMCDAQAVEAALRVDVEGKPVEEYLDHGRGNRPVVGVSWWDA
jgi:formylglycine-generating enzyme required for sulfatase activity